MQPIAFPPVELADEDGLLAIGGNTAPDTLLCAYRKGIFPWPPSPNILAWFSPDPRCILCIDSLHISRSFKRTLAKNIFSYRINGNFQNVMNECALQHGGVKRTKTWITKEMVTGYSALFEMGYGICVEVFNGQGNCVGGIYGVKINNYISAESMFHKEDDASKMALYALCTYCRSHNIKWIDLQVINPFTKSLGAEEISRERFIDVLATSLQ